MQGNPSLLVKQYLWRTHASNNDSTLSVCVITKAIDTCYLLIIIINYYYKFCFLAFPIPKYSL